MDEGREGRQGPSEAAQNARFTRAACEAALDCTGAAIDMEDREAWASTAQAYGLLYVGDQLARIADALERS